MNVVSAVLFDVPLSRLMDCGRLELSVLLTSRNSTVDLMFADSFSNCCYNKPWVVRGGKKVLKKS